MLFPSKKSGCRDKNNLNLKSDCAGPFPNTDYDYSKIVSIFSHSRFLSHVGNRSKIYIRIKKNKRQ